MIVKKELLFTVDEKNSPIEAQPRDEVHKNGIWHRTTHIWIINSEKQILCQRRSLLKDMNPGKWEPFFGGHLAPKEEYIDGAMKELTEELGIKVTEDKFTFFTVFQSNENHEFQCIFFVTWNGNIADLHLEKDEVDQVKWFENSELFDVLVKSKSDNWSRFGYEEKMLHKLAEL